LFIPFIYGAKENTKAKKGNRANPQKIGAEASSRLGNFSFSPYFFSYSKLNPHSIRPHSASEINSNCSSIIFLDLI
jgi:hypothetical protein